MTQTSTQRPATLRSGSAAFQVLLWSALGALGIFLYLRTAGMYPVVMADEWTYSLHARLTPLSESILPSYLYLWIFRATSACGTGFLDCARALNVAFFVAAAPFIYLLGRTVCSKRVAAFVALLCVLSPLASFTAFFMPEALYFFLFCVLAWAALALREAPAVRYALVTGALLGVMSLVKVHALFLLPAQLAFAIVLAWNARARGCRERPPKGCSHNLQPETRIRRSRAGGNPISQHANAAGINGMHTTLGSRLRGNDVQVSTMRLRGNDGQMSTMRLRGNDGQMSTMRLRGNDGHMSTNWIVRALIVTVVTSATMLVIKFALGYLLAGSNGLHLLGSFYGAHAGNSLGTLARLSTLIAPAVTSLKGHLLALVLLFGMPIATILVYALSPATRREGNRNLHALLLYAVLMLGAALAMTVAFTATIAAPGTIEGTRLHMRYYDFAFPLLLIGVASQVGRRETARSAPLGIVIGIGLIAASLYAALRLLPAYQLSLTDGPEIAALVQATDLVLMGRTFKMFPLLVSLQVALLGWWMISKSQAARWLVFLVLPLSVFSSNATTRFILAQFHTPNEYDTAGQFARQRLSEQDRAALAIAGSDLAGLARAQFHVDSAHAGAITLDAGAPLVASELPARRKWLLVVGQHALPADAQVEARTPQYALLRLGFSHTQTAAVSFSANAASVLERAEGLAASEAWGAWSNAQQVKLRFAKPLPAALNVFVNARAIGPNIGKDFIIRVGAQTRTFRLGASTQERFFQFATDGSARDVTIEVPQPVTPRELGLGADDRKIGLGLVGMEIGAGL